MDWVWGFLCFSDGRSRVGVYCAANACIEQVVQHGEVDVLQAVRTCSRNRPQLFESMVSFTHLNAHFVEIKVKQKHTLLIFF